MKKRLFLQGDIGAGKSTLLNETLGSSAAQAGGFVTRRVTVGGQLIGFDLAPADPRRRDEGQRFLSFEGKPRREDGVFADLGVRLLGEVHACSFALLDEFGGLELLVPEFYEALTALLQSDLPCIGVFKNRAAAEALARRVPLGEEYVRRYSELETLLQNDHDTLLLPFTRAVAVPIREHLTLWLREYGK